MKEVCPMKDPKESTTPIDSHIIDPVGAIKITQNIEFETQLMKAHTKGGLGFMAEDANSLHDRWQHKKVEDIGRKEWCGPNRGWSIYPN